MLRTRLKAAHWTKSISRGGDLVEEVDSDVDVDHVVGDLVADGHVDGDYVKMILLKVHHVEGVRVTGARLHGVQGHGGGGG